MSRPWSFAVQFENAEDWLLCCEIAYGMKAWVSRVHVFWRDHGTISFVVDSIIDQLIMRAVF